MRLFIAEKPSLARAIAEGLPKPQKRDGDCIRCGENDVVAWCVGHILEQVPPDKYDPALKSWQLGTLPIIPQAWQLQVSNPGVFKTLKKLIKEASVIVNAGDPDREGQLLVDEVIHYVGSKAPVQRLLVNDLNLPAVQKALSDIKDNADFKGISDAALSRSRADWLYGMNMTRLYTLLGKAGGYTEVLSVGRVQTPLLGLIVRRDLEIKNFVSKPFYTVKGRIQSKQGFFVAQWQPGEASEAFLDEEGRLIDRSHAQGIEKKLQHQTGTISSVETKDKKEQPPLPFALKDLQILAAKRLHLSPDRTLEIAQSLYETHKLITYPRSDCSYLPEGHTDDIEHVIRSIAANVPGYATIMQEANFSLRSPAWNDKKITAHHGIIPTPKEGAAGSLNKDEQAVYELVALRYLLQFYPAYEYRQTKATVLVNVEILTATGKSVTQEGWKAVNQNNASEDKEEKENQLPVLEQGESITVIDTELQEKQTQPPKPFTDATLLSAMTGIARYVTNEKVKKLLRESEGIGTPATQASIIKTLFDRRFIEKNGKNIHSTEVGRMLIQILPGEATLPDMTAYWEAAMNRIEEGEMSLDQFLSGIEGQLNKLIDDGKSLGRLTIPGVQVYSCPACSKTLVRRKGKKGYFWGCSGFRDGCKTTVNDVRGKPVSI